MPIAHIHILEGRGMETKRKLVSEVSRAISHSLDVEINKVRVLLHEIPEENWSVGGMSKADQNGSTK